MSREYGSKRMNHARDVVYSHNELTVDSTAITSILHGRDRPESAIG